MISIIIPVYNHEKALRRTLRSIEAQTFQEIEVIVVDDGSFQKVTLPKDFPIPAKVLYQEHAGAPRARNRGFQASVGEYVIFWDADVVAEPNMLERMKEVLDANTQTSFVYSNMRFGFKKMPARAFDGAVLQQQNYIHSTSLVRRSAVVPWDESLKKFQDWDFWLTLLEYGKVGTWIPEYLFSVSPHRFGISAWLPRFAYAFPWNKLPGIRKKVAWYEKARAIVLQKHHLV